MRRLLLSSALGLVALGILATTPGSAKAYWPVKFTGSRPANGNGNVNVIGPPTVRTQSNVSGVTKTNSSPGGDRTVVTSRDATRLWYGSSFTTVNCNPSTGFTAQSTSPSVMGSVLSPYAGFRSVNQRSLANVSNGSALSPYARYLGANSLGLGNNSIAGTRTPLSGFKAYGFQLPMSSGQFYGFHLPTSGTQAYGFHVPMSSGQFYGFHLPTNMSLPGNWALAYRSHVHFAINID